MSNTSNRSTETPSRTSIAVTTSAAVLAGTATFWLPLTDPDPGGRTLAGFVLGLVATLALACQALGRLDRRHSTGVWLDPDGRPMLVRVDDWPPGSLADLGRMVAELEDRGWRPVPAPGTRLVQKYVVRRWQ